MSRAFLVALSLMALMLSACDSSQTPSKGNFGKVIQQSHFDGHCELLDLPPPFKDQFPVTLELNVQPFDVDDSRAKFDALVAAGLLSAEDGTSIHRQWNKELLVPAKVYSLTKQGGEHLQAGKPGRWSGARQGFCIATYKVDEVKHFTEPNQGNGMGMTVSQVSFTYSPDKVSDWAKHDAVQAAFPKLKQKLAPGRSDSAMLVLTSEGWMDMKDLK